MNMIPGAAEHIVRGFFDAYFIKRDLYQCLSYLSPQIQWVGTGAAELVFDLEGATRMLKNEFDTDGAAGYALEYLQIQEHAVCDSCAVIVAMLRVARCGAEEPGQACSIRVTAVCVAGEERIQICSMHTSSPDILQQEGAYFPATMDRDKGRIEARISGKALDILNKNIPGGMMGGYLEEGFPFYYVNDRMLSYLGYTYDAFVTENKGLVIHCMHPDDRDRVNQIVTEVLGRDQEYEIQYRMRKKDGSYIWVNDVGKKGTDESGRSICISVIRDISAEMDARDRLLAEAAETERQARQYNHLFQSALCGIVLYRIADDGRMVFKNANQEAMRVFGYTPEEFWAREAWEFRQMIAPEDLVRMFHRPIQMRELGSKRSYEYRVVQQNGEYTWILGSAEVIRDADGEILIQSVFLDIDQRKKAEQRSERLSEQVEASYELLKNALEHTLNYEFYYYPQSRLCINPQRTCARFLCKSEYHDMPESFAEDFVKPEDREIFYGLYCKLENGARTASAEIESMRVDAWCRVTLTGISYTEENKPSFVIGIAEDITEQKKMETALCVAQSRDPLTGLYNKESGVRLAQEHLLSRPQEEVCCIMLLDMDDFEELNRKEGSIFADVVLQEVSDILCAETGPDDIKIRLGGDEFMLFIKNCDKARATILGPKIADQVRHLLISGSEDTHVSVSIGMCVTAVVEEYHALYRCAESTLKYVKDHGKGAAACYLDTSNELGVFLTQIYADEHFVNSIDRSNSREEDLVSFALDLLGKSKNLDDAVFLLLARIGKNLSFDRVSILDANHELLSFHYRYQWARNRADLDIDRNYYVSAEEYDAASGLYGEEGLCDKPFGCGVSMLPSCLHAAIWDYGAFVGFMSFGISEPGYVWTETQRKLLKELVKIVPSFLLKAHADAVSRAKTEFLSRMSHEIRTPMNAISGMTTIAKSVLDDREKAMECLTKIESANAYLLNLINDVLDMSRIESGKLELNLESTNLQQLLFDLEALLKPQASAKGLSITVENHYKENRFFSADSLRLNQVLVNIVGNAVKFTGPGGRVTIRVVPVTVSEGGVTVRFSVADTGVGIESAALQRIFNAFEQADKRVSADHGGTGLGLAISSRLVQMMGGTLEVASQVGIGSEFFFTLTFPYAAGASLATEPEVKCEDYDFTGRRILLAEDNEMNREIASSILEMKGFEVESAEDGREALKCFTSRDPYYFDAVLMDIRMPVMDGLEATRQLRTSGRPDARSIPVIALTANAFDDDSRKSLESGMNGHLSKPIQLDRMLSILASCMARRSREKA